eukprot:g7879.t1
MTEQVYEEPLESMDSNLAPAPVMEVPLLTQGRPALETINKEMGLAFDDWDLDYYTKLFIEDMRRNPTNVELFDIAQSNSEHSRHWYFKGEIIIDGIKQINSLMEIMQAPLKAHWNNSVIAFKDNSSAIRGGRVFPISPKAPGCCSPLEIAERDWDVLLTAETHNFPCAVAPLPGAETGAGGRIRDTHATGRGSIMGAATAGYCVGNLKFEQPLNPNYTSLHQWSVEQFSYPEELATSNQVLIEASNGVSDYGNKFGEPVIAGFTRSFGQRLPDGSRREWIKPIMFSGGLGQINHLHLEKLEAELSMLVVKIGGPAYRIGMGGGAASSLPSGSNKAELDYNAVQRGDAEMAQKLWRVVRACVELNDINPIVQIHDQGAGGNCNVVKEIVYPKGAEIDLQKITLGDPTMSVLEIWGAEYQENDCLLIREKDRHLLEEICAREACDLQVLGQITGTGRIIVRDGDQQPPVDLDLEQVLGSMPQKSFSSTSFHSETHPLDFSVMKINESLDRVLSLPSVCSKRFLTTKVDRHVTGLVAQQQCVGPLQLPLSDVGVVARSHENVEGIATAIGEQPLKGLLNPSAMARLALGEAITNLVWAQVTALEDVKCSVNWMFAAKMGSEGAAMYSAANALSQMMIQLGLACDGGKDSLSMSAQAGNETVMAPGNLVISAYVLCPDITKTVTPDLKLSGEENQLIHCDLSQAKHRLGGSALAQAHDQLGDECPDLDPEVLKSAFNVTQELIKEGQISAGHDISDGGIITTVLEMAFSGNCGIDIDFKSASGETSKEEILSVLFAEELGLVLEVNKEIASTVVDRYLTAGVPCISIGKATDDCMVKVRINGESVIERNMTELRDIWESTSFELEQLQCVQQYVKEEQSKLKFKTAPKWHMPFIPEFTPKSILNKTDKIKVAVIRAEGSNGDREMAAAIHAGGMEPWDVTMTDLLTGRASLDSFSYINSLTLSHGVSRGLVFVGGFSFADVLDSAKGWSGTILFNEKLLDQFSTFYKRPDTFSLGVCNGCQLMALLGWVPGDNPMQRTRERQPRFIHNKSGRFESRWLSVRIEEKSKSIWFEGMEGSVLGIWSAHGEGQAYFLDQLVLKDIEQRGLVPLRYCNVDGVATEDYPENPNGSVNGIAALCSENGRHLALMPHPERCYLTWQMPWYPRDLKLNPDGPSPWIKIFQNARLWAEQNQN